MASQFPVEIRVTGDDVARLFGEIAGAAEKAQTRIDRANRRTEAGLRAVNAGMSDLRGAADAALGRLGPVGSALGALGSAGVAGVAIGGITAIGAGLFTAAKRAAEFADEIDDSAKRIGIGVEALQEYRFAASQVGISTESMQRALQVFVRNVGAAQLGSDTLAKALGAVDQGFVDSVKSAGSTERQLDLVVDKIASLASVSEQARVAQVFFGKSAAELVPLFAQGADGIAALRDRARELGVVIDESLIASGGSASDTLDQLSASIRGNLTTALLQLAPTLEASAAGLASFVAAAGRALDKTFGLSIQGQIDALVEQIENAKKSLSLGGPESVGPGLTIEQLRQQVESLQAQLANQGEARRQRNLATQLPAARAEAARGADEALEGAQKVSPDPADKLKELEAQRREAQAKLREAARLEARDAEAIARAKEEIDKRYGAAKEKVVADAARATEAAAKKETAVVEKAANDQARAVELVADAKRRASLAGLDGEARFREQARQDIEQQSTQIRELVKDEQKAAELIATYRVEREKEAQAEIDDFKADQAEKDAKRAADLWEREQKLDQDRLEKQAKEAEKVRKDELDAAKDNAEALAKAREEALRPIENTLLLIQRDLGDALVNAFTQGEDAAQSFQDVAINAVQAIAGELLQLAVTKSVVEPLMGSLQGAGGLLGGLFGGGATAAAGAVPGVTSLPAGVAGPVMTPAAAAAAGLGGESALGAVAGWAALVVALGAATKALVDSRTAYEKVTLGTDQGAKNALTGIQAGLIAGFTAGGAAIGSAVPIVGTAVGAALGAAIGTAASQAIEQGVTRGISDGVAAGLTQAQLEDRVVKELQGDVLLNILSGGSNQLASSVFGPLVTPDIEDIFAKMFRRAVGGPYGLDTAGVQTTGRDGVALGIGDEVSRAARIIAEALGAGGAAYGAERAANFEGILAGGVRKRAAETGDDAGVVLAEAFVGAFQGSFLEAAKAALKTGERQRTDNLQFTAAEFGKGAPNFGFNYGQLATVIEREGNVPQGRARKQAREAFGSALEAAFADAADSDAFRKSLANSVQQAFAKQGATALTKALGELAAPFFSISRENRQDLRRARRRGDAGATLDILTEEFRSGADEFATFVSDPAFAKGIQALTDEFLRLQVAMALASGDTRGAADAIEQSLAPQLQLVRDAAQLSRDVRSRTAIALAGPGFAGDRVQVDELRRISEETEARFRSRYGTPTMTGAGELVGARLIDGATRLDPVDLETFTGDLREFADARLAGLEAEIALQRQLADTLKQAARAFGDLREQADIALDNLTANDTFARQVTEAQAAYAAAAASAFEDTALVADLQTALSTAIATALSRIDAFDALVEQFDELGRSIRTALGTETSATRITALFDALNAGVAQTPEALSKAAAQLSEATSLAINRRDTFQGAADDFGAFSESANVARRGRRGQRDLLARRRAEIAQLLGTARGGGAAGEGALTDLRRLLPEALSLGQSALSGGRFRALATELERAGTEAAGLAQQQATLAERQLTVLEQIATALGVSAEDGAADARSQLDLLRVLAADAEGKTGSASAAALARLGEVKQELVDFRQDITPILEYVETKAGQALTSEFDRLVDKLGPNGDVVRVLNEVRDRLPRSSGGTRNVVTSGVTDGAPVVLLPSGAPAAAAPVAPVTISSVVIQFQQPPQSAVQAREYGRQIGDALLERVHQYQQRTTLKKVA
jgi:hypothetical protein